LDYYKRDDSFKGDIILVEPRADDEKFFSLNPLLLRNRIEAAKLGFWSVRNSVEEKFDEISNLVKRYGIEMSRDGVEDEFRVLAEESSTKTEIQSLLEGRKGKAKRARGKGRARMKRAVSRVKRKRKTKAKNKVKAEAKVEGL